MPYMLFGFDMEFAYKCFVVKLCCEILCWSGVKLCILIITKARWKITSSVVSWTLRLIVNYHYCCSASMHQKQKRFCGTECIITDFS